MEHKVKAALLSVVMLLCSLTGCNNNQTEFDFDEAVKNIMLFGSRISLPCVIENLGKEFTIAEPSEWVVIGDAVTSNLYYENKKIGSVNLSESDGDEIQIIGLTLGFGLNSAADQDEEIRKVLFDSYGWYSEEIEIDFNGLSFNSSENEIKLCLGTPKETTDAYFDDYLVYEYPNGRIWIRFYQDTITEFTVLEEKH